MLKYSLGLDISAYDIHCCFSVIDYQQRVTVKSSCKVTNNHNGFEQMVNWLGKHRKQQEIPLAITMEATGVYFEHCALFLYRHQYNIAVVLPNKAKKYLQATGLKSKNDKIDAQGLARMGAEQSLELWQPMGEYYYQLRILTRHHQSIQELKTNISNQLHADQKGMYINKEVLGQLNALIETLEKQVQELNELIEAHIGSNADIASKVKNVCTVKGLGLHTVAVILAETNGFLLFKNSRQLVSYAGYDVVQNESGKHKGKTRISKKGNSRMRRALFMPAFSVVTHKVKPFLDLYQRTFVKHNQKMKSYVAVQKKLLVLIYSLWKAETKFDENHFNKKSKEQEPELPFGSSAIAEAMI
jgi:transposase